MIVVIHGWKWLPRMPPIQNAVNMNSLEHVQWSSSISRLHHFNSPIHQQNNEWTTNQLADGPVDAVHPACRWWHFVCKALNCRSFFKRSLRCGSSFSTSFLRFSFGAALAFQHIHGFRGIIHLQWSVCELVEFSEWQGWAGTVTPLFNSVWDGLRSPSSLHPLSGLEK